MFLTGEQCSTYGGGTRQVHPLHAPGLRCPRAGGRRCGPRTRENQMMLRTQWYPLHALRRAQEVRAQTQMDSLFAHALGLHGQWQSATGASTPAWAPALDIAERKDAYL